MLGTAIVCRKLLLKKLLLPPAIGMGKPVIQLPKLKLHISAWKGLLPKRSKQRGAAAQDEIVKYSWPQRSCRDLGHRKAEAGNCEFHRCNICTDATGAYL